MTDNKGFLRRHTWLYIWIHTIDLHARLLSFVFVFNSFSYLTFSKIQINVFS